MKSALSGMVVNTQPDLIKLNLFSWEKFAMCTGKEAQQRQSFVGAERGGGVGLGRT